jgi:hypothetical protein
LFDRAEEGVKDELQQYGAYPDTLSGSRGWRLPDGRIVVEAEALAWLARQKASGAKPWTH